jgi:hypothetical protein
MGRRRRERKKRQPLPVPTNILRGKLLLGFFPVFEFSFFIIFELKKVNK